MPALNKSVIFLGLTLLLYIVDSGNNRIAIAQGVLGQGTTGGGGTGLGQFSGPVNISVSERGVYIADTGNNRIQEFGLSPSHSLFTITPASTRFAFTDSFSQPSAVATVNNLTADQFYVADTGNNRIILCTAPNADSDSIQGVWNSMVSRVNSGDFIGASTFFSVASSDNYLRAFFTVGTANAASAISQIGTLNPVYIYNDRAEYYFNSTGIINGQAVGFPVEFDKENGAWKILEF